MIHITAFFKNCFTRRSGTPEEGKEEIPAKRKLVRFRSQAQFFMAAASLGEPIVSDSPFLRPEPVVGPPVRLRSASLTETTITFLRTKPICAQPAVPRSKPATASLAETRTKTTALQSIGAARYALFTRHRVLSAIVQCM